MGLGESTRAAHETFTVRDQLFRRLVREHGFRIHINRVSPVQGWAS
ncbi:MULTISPECIES: hypothetical protein [unclassified Streptomyces]